MKKRGKSSHKGQNGVVLVIGGSELYVGAPIMSTMAALATGIDLAYIAAPKDVALTANAYSPDIISIKLSGNFLKQMHVAKFKKFMQKADCIIIGPGLGLKKETMLAVRKIVRLAGKPLVIDADALHAIKGMDVGNCVLTPHHGEFFNLFDEFGSKRTVKKFAAKDRIILLKGPADLVSDGKKGGSVKGGSDAMRVGGTGDVLTGIIAGLIAQGTPLMAAAVKASKINKKAGEIVFKKKHYGLLASDLIKEIPDLI
ncbi:NAD(P)H-hydrate dehydratase [Candidatus Woesearchaeota archaeon]|nr:NAD(P)H-hydrate dehydratase [Candidatus Woesearchaeota archaeon]